MPTLERCKQILGDLISYDVLGGQSNLSIIHYIRKIFDQSNVQYFLVEDHDQAKACIHCRIGPDVPGGIILSGHTDVVPVEGQDWQSSPFKMLEKEGLLYGRGSCDMKGFLACCLANISTFQESTLKRPVYFAFSYDEEIGCLSGVALAKAMKQSYTHAADFAIIGEPTMMQALACQKGMSVLKTTIYGSAGHSSRINQEVSAIHVAARLIVWLEEKMESLASKGMLDYRFDPPHSTIHIGKIQGGIAPNVIADQCYFYWDVRVIPQDNVEEIIHSFELFCAEYQETLRKRFADTLIVTETNHDAVPPLDTPENAPIIPIIKLLTGEENLRSASYATEAGQYSEAGFSTVICGPGDIAQAHRANEYVSIKQLNLCMAFMKKLADYLSSSNFDFGA